MKSKLALIAALCAIAFPMTFAGDETKPATPASPGNEAASVAERLVEVDFSVTLEHYRKIRARQLDEELDILYNPDGAAKQNRDEILAHLEIVRVQAIEHGAKLQKLRDARRSTGSGR